MNVQSIVARSIEAGARANHSPFPASFDGSTLRFQLALFAMMSLSIMGGMIATWMARELVKGKHDAYPWEPLFAIRVIFFLCAFQAVIRCAPEAAYMMTYREDMEWSVQILLVKRWFDAAAIMPGLAWMTLVAVFYTPICSQMIVMSRQAPAVPRISKSKLRRMLLAIALTFLISALIAVGKR